MTAPDLMFQQRRPWKMSRVVVGLILFGLIAAWVVQVVRNGSFVSNPNVTQVQSSTPSPGDRAVRVNSLITLHLTAGRAVDTTTLENVRLFKPTTGMPAMARVTASGAGDEITVTPLAPLEGETLYHLDIKGVKDADGNDLAPYLLSFTTGVGSAETPAATLPTTR